MDTDNLAALLNAAVGAEHTVTPNADGTYSHSWSFPRQPVQLDGYDTIESEEELQQALAARATPTPEQLRLLNEAGRRGAAAGQAWRDRLLTAAPLADITQVRLLGHRYGQPLAPSVYRRLHWWATVASVQHLPKRTRLRLLARIRRDMRSTR